MNQNNKSDNAYKTIGEVTKELGLIDKKTGRPQTHTLRYWEKQFNQIKPTIRAGGRRHYSPKNLQMIKHLKFLLKEKGLTINGAKKILNMKKSTSIDDEANIDINKPNLENTKLIKRKLKNISKIIKELKKIK